MMKSKRANRLLFNHPLMVCRIIVILLVGSLFLTIFSSNLNAACANQNPESAPANGTTTPPNNNQISPEGGQSSSSGGDGGGQHPVACFTWSPSAPEVGEPVQFNASCSYDLNSQSGDTKTAPSNPEGGSQIGLTEYIGGGSIPSNVKNIEDSPSICPDTGPDGGTGGGPGSGFDAVGAVPAQAFAGSLLYSWDFGDGNTSAEERPIHTYTVAAEYIVSLTVYNATNDYDTLTAYITVSPSSGNPVAVIDSIMPNPAVKGEKVTFAGHGVDTDGSIIGYNWTSSKDGFLNSSASFSTTTLTPGTHLISFTVQNDNFEWSEAATRTLIINILPTAKPGGPYLGSVKTPLTLDGSGSTDTDGSITGYKWVFGDGASSTEIKPKHTYLHAGTYTVTLTVTDNRGATGAATTTAKIVGNPPVANASGPYFGYENHPVSFNGSHSTDSDGYITKWEWRFGDGSNGTGMKPTHTYTHKGSYTVTLTVTDNDNEKDSDTTTAVIIGNLPPNPPHVNGSLSGYTDIEYVYSAVSTDPENDSLRYFFDWGDDTNFTSPFFPSGTVISASHTWISPGTYQVNVTAIDEKNATSDTTTLIVNIKDNSSTSSQESNTDKNGFTGLMSGFNSILNIGQFGTIAWTIIVLALVGFGIRTALKSRRKK